MVLDGITDRTTIINNNNDDVTDELNNSIAGSSERQNNKIIKINTIDDDHDTIDDNNKILMNYGTLRTKCKNDDQIELINKENNLIGSYCTIRPNVRNNRNGINSKNLTNFIENDEQNNFCTFKPKRLKSINSDQDLEAMNVITQLDRILETHTDSYLMSNSGEDIIVDMDKDNGIIYKSDPDRIAACLSDLDAYLEEIDDSNTTTIFDENLQTNIIDDRAELIANEFKLNNNLENLKYNSKKSINNQTRILHFATLPKNNKIKNKLLTKTNSPTINQQQETDLIDFIPIDNIDEFTLKRSHPFRNTIDGVIQLSSTSTLSLPSSPQKQTKIVLPLESDESIITTLENPNINHFRRGRTRTELEPQRRLSWLRNSMRKIRPILLPEQPDQNDAGTTSDTIITTQTIMPTTITTTSTRTTSTILQTPSIDPPSYQESNFMMNQRRHLSAPTATPTAIQSTQFTNINFPLDIFDHETTEDRPRQFGRRAEIRPRLISIVAETIPYSVQRTTMTHHERPNSAPPQPARIITINNHTNNTNTNSTRTHFISSEPSSGNSSRNPSPVSLVSSTGSSSIGSGTENNNERPRQRQQSTSDPDETQQTDSADETIINNNNSNNCNNSNGFTKWPNQYGRALATICCTLGLFNLSRFSIFSIHFGANFIVQFLILSFIFGIPMLWLQMCLGVKIRCGPITMWNISPICKGISISLLIAQGFIGLYTTISLGWILVYFRDSIISRTTNYRWNEIYELYRGQQENITVNLSERVSDYFNGVVLQRHQLISGTNINGIGTVRFQLAFNISILWTTVFVILCKGLRSYGKIVLGLSVLPLIGLTAVCIKFITVIDFNAIQNLFPATDWQEFFPNSQSWMTAAQETFLTWNLFGASVLSICSKTNKKLQNKTTLRRDAVIVVLITIYGLIVAAILGNVCVQILSDKGYFYYSGSYETLASNVFLYPTSSPLPQNILSIPSKYLPRYASVLGESFYRPTMSLMKESGYQVIRLATELLPATFAVATQNEISCVWCLFAYLTLLLFGIGQLCAIWKPIASALGNTPSSVLLSCVVGLLLGIPLATESGINIIHFFDVIFGGAWWILILWIGQIIGVFLVRGRPYTGDILVNDLRLSQTLSAFLAFSWNVLIPIVMMLLCVLDYKASNSKDLFHRRGPSYWPHWVRQVGGFIQVSFLILVPVTAVVQIYRYLSKGPPDILDRIQMLYRPDIETTQMGGRPIRRLDIPAMSSTTTITIPLEARTPVQDEPPKYTPPPSYTTATGARLAKLFRQSIRRSVRRIMGGETSERRRNRPALPQSSSLPTPQTELNLPPDYSTVFSDPAGEIGPRALYNSHTQRDVRPNIVEQQRNNIRRLTAHDVAQLLRPSSRAKSHRTSSLGGSIGLKTNIKFGISRSVENLVLNVAPLGESNNVITLLNYNSSNDISSNNNNNRQINNDENVSVI